MRNNVESAKSRLNNLRAIEPLLGALRTLSLGTMQTAQHRLDALQSYREQFNQILVEILPQLDLDQKQKKIKSTTHKNSTVILIIGTERGLCGQFNQTLTDRSFAWISEKAFADPQIWAMGTQLIKTIEKTKAKLAWRKPLPPGKLTTYQTAYRYTQNWIEQFESRDFDAFYLLFNQIGKHHQITFSNLRLLPYQVDHFIEATPTSQKKWPPPIIETDPKGIYNQIIQHYIAINLMRSLLKSAAAEHSARYNLMEDAKKNADEIIDELSLLINMERKRKITQQMQELAVGAGLLDES